jgi:hypothetical protein
VDSLWRYKATPQPYDPFGKGKRDLISVSTVQVRVKEGGNDGDG